MKSPTPSRPSLHAYSGAGLRGIWLRNGYQVRQTHYGRGVSYQDSEGLDRVIADVLCRSTSPLTADGVIFLRRWLRMTQPQLGFELGYSDQAIATWEKGRAIPATASRLLRLLAMSCVQPALTLTEALAAVGHPTASRGKRLVFEYHPSSGWRLT